MLHEGDLTHLERFAELSSKKLVASIQNSKHISLSRFLQALSISYVGEGVARDIARAFGSLEKVESASLEELENVPDVGPKTAKQIFKFFQDEKNRDLIKKLKDVGVVIKKEKTQKKFDGKVFVITGSLEKMTREEAKQKISHLGGKVSSSVSRNTNYLVVGDNPGSKLKEAKALKRNIINEAEFLNLINEKNN